MTRKSVKADVVRNWHCQICGRNWPSKRSLAQHIAQKKDEAHKNWRIENDIEPPDTDTMRDVPNMVSQIELLIDDWQL